MIQEPIAAGGALSSHFYQERAVFSESECNHLEACIRAADLAPGMVGRHVQNAEFRRSGLLWLPDDEVWVQERLKAFMLRVNDEIFRFRLDGEPERPQLASYTAENEGHYAWHIDLGTSGQEARRKLTLTIQLSDPAAYIGGDLHLNTTGRPFQADKTRGGAVCFPSYVVHRVTPVLRGVRHSLVAWFRGPRFE